MDKSACLPLSMQLINSEYVFSQAHSVALIKSEEISCFFEQVLANVRNLLRDDSLNTYTGEIFSLNEYKGERNCIVGLNRVRVCDFWAKKECHKNPYELLNRIVAIKCNALRAF